MPKPYSMDLRERALARFRAGESARSVAAALSIGVSTAVRWGQRYRRTGNVAPLPMGGSEPTSIVGDDATWMRERIASGNCTVRGLAVELKERGLQVHPGTVWLFLRREGMSFKKNRNLQLA